MATTAMSTLEKGDAMIQWAEKVKCPKEIQLNPYTKIVDTSIYLSTQIGTMKAHKPSDRVWVLAYLRIYDLKTFLIEKKQNAK